MFQIEMQDGRRWSPLGGVYATREEAERAVEKFGLAFPKDKERQFRIVRAR